MIARRQFLQSAAIIPAVARSRADAATSGLEGSLARLIFLHDAAAVAVHSMAVPKPLARAVAGEVEAYFAGSWLQSAGSGPAAEMAMRAGRAALEAYASAEPETTAGRLAWDARLLRELAARGGPARREPTEQEIAEWFDVLSRRALVAIHTYIPDEADVEGWMVRLIRLHNAVESYWSGLAAACARGRATPDAMYDPADPLVRAAAALHHGPLDPGAVAEALLAQPRCAYGRALKQAHQRFLAL